MRRPRVIDLHRTTSLRALLVDELLIHIFRDSVTDLICVEVHVFPFSFQLNDGCRLATRRQAVRGARDFLRVMNYGGRVWWQMGVDGPISDEPYGLNTGHGC